MPKEITIILPSWMKTYWGRYLTWFSIINLALLLLTLAIIYSQKNQITGEYFYETWSAKDTLDTLSFYGGINLFVLFFVFIFSPGVGKFIDRQLNKLPKLKIKYREDS